MLPLPLCQRSLGRVPGSRFLIHAIHSLVRSLASDRTLRGRVSLQLMQTSRDSLPAHPVQAPDPTASSVLTTRARATPFATCRAARAGSPGETRACCSHGSTETAGAAPRVRLEMGATREGRATPAPPPPGKAEEAGGKLLGQGTSPGGCGSEAGGVCGSRPSVGRLWRHRVPAGKPCGVLRAGCCWEGTDADRAGP